MNFEGQKTIVAVEMDIHIPDRDMVIPFTEAAVRKWRARGEIGAQFIAYLNGTPILKGACRKHNEPPEIEFLYQGITLPLKRGDKLRLQFSKMLVDPTKDPNDPKNQRDPSPAITIGMECTAVLDQ